ncbi:3-deoxy-8-phosphooctulonate synthase [Tropicibacter naphthalenivorans]|uniref:2-dehydro-3-deoxyphosphooctonate aldolase n=1 Tax=Tropicibacter naphthalenivorans TaxID=441103 RepID=A0A0N7M158_9RHOB|nr:3-deoxy-8-phosphooctulonate synthase [Tropicibacter naphthalenivorans]CUH82345.1 2-dehydro-3-deoxyphosphooctonate aldolase [Tropicibacter naphthalenivorans]SMD05703.1 2-dehydro-3-deoxyphosphooctonate aldolase (KDO 8-P synthase) [Tropicibacter naphthalenivorans]
MTAVTIKDITIAADQPFALIAGPCQLETLDHARMLAEKIAAAAEANRTPWIFKGSFDKANRSSLEGKRGIGMDEGLHILSTIGREFGVPVLTDVHETAQCAPVAEAVDILQIPAFLCRQTDLLLAAGETGAAINIKKGQFLAPHDMGNVADKIASTGNQRIMLCERGTSFGYNMLVSDFRALPIMAQTGYPVVFDATHSVQMPGGMGKSSGGKREYVEPLARAALAVGCAAVFMETHEAPDTAPSDGPNMVPVEALGHVLHGLRAIDDLTKGRTEALAHLFA